MFGRRAEGHERLAMLGRAVAHVALPAIARIFFRQAAHQAVPCHLGNDRGGRDGGNLCVTFDEGFASAAERRAAVSIHQRQAGSRA